MATLGLMLIMTGIAVANLREFNDPLQNGAASLTGFLKQIRAQAIASTSAYIISASDTTHVITEVATSCTDPAPVADQLHTLEMPTGSYFFDSTWTLCFTSRGFPDANIEIDLRDNDGTSKIVEVLLGGSVRTL